MMTFHVSYNNIILPVVHTDVFPMCPNSNLASGKLTLLTQLANLHAYNYNIIIKVFLCVYVFAFKATSA